MTVNVIVTGSKELAARVDKMPERLHAKLRERIKALTDQLYQRILNSEPFRTGKLKSETVERNFSDSPERIAGYVSIYAPDAPGEYAKAATLEYGSDKPRRSFERAAMGMIARFAGRRARIVKKLSKPVHIQARMYLRGPLAAMQPEVDAAVEEAIAEALNEQ